MFDATYVLSDFLHSLSSATGISGAVIGLAAGLLILIFGYRLKRVALTLVGIFLGLAGGLLLVDRFFMDSAVLSILVPIAGAVIGALLSSVVYKIALYVLGFAAGGAAGLYLSINYISNPAWGILIAGLLAIVLGTLALFFEKPIIILATSFLGYMLFRLGLYLLIQTDENLVVEIISLVLLVGGIAVQFLINRDRDTRGEAGRKDGPEYGEAER
jgi:hypothetical protein